MAKGGQEIRSRIKSVAGTQQITKAMKMVSAAKLRKSESRAQASRPYSSTLTEVLSNLAGVATDVEHPFLRAIAPDVPRVMAVLFTSDKGLCGAYNSHLFHKATEFIRDQQGQGRQVRLVLAGKKGNQFFSKSRPDVVAGYYPGFTNKTTFADLRRLTNQLTGAYLNKEVSEVFLIYARYINVVKNIPTVVRLLPVEGLAPGDDGRNGHRVEYDLEPDPHELLRTLLPRYFQTVLFQASIESFTSENGARMVAMDNATNAAADMIDSLTLQYNKARQAGITLELLDIVGGSEALKG
jgi:F-type H+-transporting ATPase subunit gamma